jgi:glycosyltransferase involved in cell wall biosynthesis
MDIIGLLSFWYGECAVVGKRFGEKNGIKHYCWLFGQDARKENAYPRKLQPGPNELIALSDFLQDEFERNHGVRPTFVIPPGIDMNAGGQEQKKDIDILGAGSLISLKQYDIFLRVVSEIKKQFTQLKVMLVGDGPEKNGLMALNMQLGLESTVTFTGEIPHSVVLQLMERSRIFLHPSSYEGFSGVCMEALGRGTHVISFCKPMHHDIEQWHIVHSEEEMKKQALEILIDHHTAYNPVNDFPIQATVNKVVQLFEKNS